MNRVVRMLLVHDVGEIDTGDTMVFVEGGWEDRKAAELAAVERIFGLLVDLEIDPENVDVNKLFKNAAEIGKASVNQKRFSMEARAAIKDEARRELLAEQKAQLDALGNKGGVTAETKLAIREALGIR